MEEITPIQQVIDIVGGVTVCARLAGVSPPTVHEWKTGKRKVPVERCQQLEQLVNGRVTCEEMRPDKFDYFAYMRSRPSPELAGVGVLMPGDALGYDALNPDLKKAA